MTDSMNLGKKKLVSYRLESILKTEIQRKTELSTIRRCIVSEYGVPLDNYTSNFINICYIRLCFEFWLKDIAGQIDDFDENERNTKLLRVFNQFDRVSNFANIPQICRRSEYFKLLNKDEHKKLIDRKSEEQFVRVFKAKWCEKTLDFNGGVEDEIDFLTCLTDVLCICSDIVEIIDLEGFCDGRQTFEKLLVNIKSLNVTNKKMKLLREYAEVLSSRRNILTLELMKNDLKKYTEPIKISKCMTAVEVKGKNIVVSKVLNQIDDLSDVDEVRFVGANYLHVDADLPKEIWHGKNIFILANHMVVHKEVVWDISGLDDDHVYESRAEDGGDDDEDGKYGADGHAGESGGTIIIKSDAIENSHNLKIISRGGRGSDGQAGGHGKHGSDGTGLTYEELKEAYPFPNEYKKDKSKNMPYEAFILDKLSALEDLYVPENEKSCVKRGEDDKGRLIKFLRCPSTKYMRKRKNYILIVEGAYGNCGGNSGLGGFGGEGGFCGEIVVDTEYEHATTVHKYKGKPGKNGDDGKCGEYGKDGWDIGFIYKSSYDQPVIYGKNQLDKLHLEQSPEKLANSIWCPVYEKFVRIAINNPKYKMGKSLINFARDLNYKKSQESFAKRKKALVLKSMLEHYYNELEDMNWIKAYKSDLKATYNKIIDELEEQKSPNEITDKIVHLIYFFQRAKKYISIASNKMNETRTSSVANLADDIRTNIECWRKIKDYKFDNAELKDLRANLDKFHIKNDDIQTMLLAKYRLNVLQNIAASLDRIPHYDHGSNSIDGRYLTETTDKCVVVHQSLGDLHDYLWGKKEEHRRNIADYAQQIRYRNNTLRLFVHELIADGWMQQICKRHQASSNERRDEIMHILQIFDEKIEADVDISRRIDCKSDGFMNESTRDLIQGRSDLMDLYERLDRLCNERPTLAVHEMASIKDYDVICKGSSSYSYREMLANIFSVQIRFYCAGFDGALELKSVHNESAEDSVFVLHKDDESFRLVVDRSYLEMIEERRLSRIAHVAILREAESIDEIEDLDAFMKDKTSNSHSIIDYAMNDRHFDPCYINEDEMIHNIAEHFPLEERALMGFALNKIKSEYIGKNDILERMWRRFSCESRHLSVNSFRSLIATILGQFLQGNDECDNMSWIVSVCPQKDWITEAVCMELEHFLRKPLTNISNWKNLISNIDIDTVLLFKEKLYNSKGSLDEEFILNVVQNLDNISIDKMSLLEDAELSEWAFIFRDASWSTMLSKNIDLDAKQLSSILYIVSNLENIYGTILISDLIKAISPKYTSYDDLHSILQNFHNDIWMLNEYAIESIAKCDVIEFFKRMDEKHAIHTKERKTPQLLDLVINDENTSDNIRFKLVNLIETYNISDDLDANQDDISKIADDIRTEFSRAEDKHALFTEKCEEMLSLINRSIQLVMGFSLRDAQKLAVLSLLINEKNTLAQVATGEGKTLIVVTVAIMKALQGEKVDIVTSSSVLAKRDAADNEKIYKLFNIEVSHNCHEKIEERINAYSKFQVIYGDLSNFQRDFLLDRFYGKNILGDRTFGNIIIDEVDSLLLDKAINILYLSQELPAFDKLEAVYIHVWQWVNRFVRMDSSDIVVDRIKDAIMFDIFGTVKKNHIYGLSATLDEARVKVIWEALVLQNIVDKDGKIMTEDLRNLDGLDFKGYENELRPLQDRLCFLLQEHIGRERRIRIPNYLLSFVERHIESWIANAIRATLMKEGGDYVVDVDHSATSSDLHARITILDIDTGTDLPNSQWDKGLHQFLELKHGCKLSPLSLKAVFISNVSFFKKYQKLSGLTGTLGSIKERKLLKEIYNIEYVTIPTSKRSLFHEEKSIICVDREEWHKNIFDKTIDVTINQKRSILIICETISWADDLYKKLKELGIKNLHIYKRDYEKFSVIVENNKKLQDGVTIIATNLAGRGTDIKITDELNRHGGLHVCLTYLPTNVRIEQQAFGRSARNGNHGSGCLIILDDKGKEIVPLKNKRDQDEAYRISQIYDYYQNQIIPEEECLSFFESHFKALDEHLSAKYSAGDEAESFMSSLKNSEFYAIFSKKLEEQNAWPSWFPKSENKNIMEVKRKIISKTHMNRWAIWLDENEKMASMDVKDKDAFFKNLKQLINWDNLSTLVCGDPVQINRLGKVLADENLLDDAIKIFDKVIEQEPSFSEAAHYYKAHALARSVPSFKENQEIVKLMRKSLKRAKKLFSEHRLFTTIAESVVKEEQKHHNCNIIQIDSFEKQKQAERAIYDVFLQSIDNVLGKCNISMDDFDSIDEELADKLIRYFVSNGALKSNRIKKNFQKKDLSDVSMAYGIKADLLYETLTGHKGRDVDLDKFIYYLKEQIELPSREDFWKELLEFQVLDQAIEFVEVLPDDLIAIRAETTSELSIDPWEVEDGSYLYFNPIYDISAHIFEKWTFHELIGDAIYQKYEKEGRIRTNKKAQINKSKIQDANFRHFDYVQLHDLSEMISSPKEAELILDELTRQGIIRPHGGTAAKYQLIGRLDQIDYSPFPVYETMIKTMISLHFAYRIALNLIEQDLNNEQDVIFVDLNEKPHSMLVLDLMDRSIIKPMKFSNVVQDYEILIKEFLSDEKRTSENLRDILENVNRLRGEMYLKSEVKMQSLQKYLGNNQLVSSMELKSFSLNGLDCVIKQNQWSSRLAVGYLLDAMMGIAFVVFGCLTFGINPKKTEYILRGAGLIFQVLNASLSKISSWKNFWNRATFYQTLKSIATRTMDTMANKIRSFKYGSAVISAAGYVASFFRRNNDPKFKLSDQTEFSTSTKTVWDRACVQIYKTDVVGILQSHFRAFRKKVVGAILALAEFELVQCAKLDEENILGTLVRNYFLQSSQWSKIEKCLRRCNQDLTESIKRHAFKRDKVTDISSLIGVVLEAMDVSDLSLEKCTHLKNASMELKKLLNATWLEFDIDPASPNAKEHAKACKVYAVFQEQMAEKVDECIVDVFIYFIASRIRKDFLDSHENLMEVHETLDAIADKCKTSKDSTECFIGESDRFTNEAYCANCMKLIAKTRSSELLSIVVRENIPIDMMCLQILTYVASKVCKTDGLRIVFQIDNVTKQQFSFRTKSQKTIFVNVKRKYVHQLKYDNFLVLNACGRLYQSLKAEELIDSTRDEFIQNISDWIQKDYTVPFIIEAGWHQRHLPLDKHTIRALNELNEEIERDKKCQHSGWSFDVDTDIDLRQNRKLSHDEQFQQIEDAFKICILKINTILKSLNTNRALKVSLDDLSTVQRGTLLRTAEDGTIDIRRCAIKYEMTGIIFKKITLHAESSQLTKRKKPFGTFVKYTIEIGDEEFAGYIILNDNEFIRDERS